MLPVPAPSWIETLILVLMILGEFFLFALPAVFWALAGRQPWLEAFSWRRPPPAAWLGGVLLGLGLIPWVSSLVVVQNMVYPPFIDMGKAQNEALLPLMQHDPILLVLGLPFSAAISEEMLFRGPLQRALLRRLPAWAALWLGGLIFAAIHLDAQGLIARTVLGALLGWTVLRTRSLFPAILAHFVYDFALLASSVQQLHALGARRVLELASQPALGMSRTELWIGPLIGTVLLLIGARLCRQASSAE